MVSVDSTEAARDCGGGALQGRVFFGRGTSDQEESVRRQAVDGEILEVVERCDRPGEDEVHG